MAKIKKIKLGATTYDLCDADAVHTVKQDGVTGATVNRFGTCGTAAGTAAKTVSITTGTFSLETGAKVTVKFTNKNTAGTPTLNVNSTGAKNIYHNGSQITTGTNKGMLNGTVEFVYDGTQWQLIGNYVDTNSSHAIISGLKKDGETNIQGSSSSGNITLGDSGVSAGYYGPESTDNPASDGTIVVPELAVNAKGVIVDATNRTLSLPSLTITDKPSADGSDTVYAVTNLVEGGTNGHAITATYTGLPTKSYVDRIATGHVKYLGTVSALTGLATTAGQGDFYRVSTAFTFGSETAHVGDIILATKNNPNQNTSDWDLIHAEVDTNTWTANTKDNAGYVAAGTGKANQVWSTDASGNPSWKSPREAHLTWGGANHKASYGPIDAAMIPELGANRFAFLPTSKVTLEYSTNSGVSWTSLNNDELKAKLFSTGGLAFQIGNSSATKVDKSTYMSRVTVTTTSACYSILNKFALYISTSGSTGCYCSIDCRTKANQDSGTETWVNFADKVPIDGWSGWNIINTSNITTHGNQSAQYSQIRFTFGVTAHAATSEYPGLHVTKILAFGGMGWTTPSNMATNGHLYSYDHNKKATFPGDVTVASGKKFIGPLSGTASAASTVTQNVVDDSTEYNLLLSTSNSSSTETGAVNKANTLSFFPASGTLLVGYDYDPDDGAGNISGELHVFGNIYAGAGNDNYGIYPERANWSEVGGEYDKYWYKMHSTNYYGSNFFYKTDIDGDDTTSGDNVTELRDCFAAKDHTHATSLATNTGTSSITLSHGGKYKLTAGGSSVVFTMPGSGNTDTKVNTILGTTTKAYLLGTSTTPTSTTQAVTAVADTGVYLDTTAGQLTATTFKGALKGNADTATNVAWSGVTSKPSYYDAKAITSISRSGTTFTATYLDGTTTTFTQQDNNSDTKVTNTLDTATKAYVTGTTSATTNTGTQIFDTGIYINTTAGELCATSFKGAHKGDLDGTALSATALTTDNDKGSATNPIYFSGGKPVACTYSLNKTVPSNAVFTDTDTKVKQYNGQSSPYQYDLLFRYDKHGTADDTNYSRYSSQLSYFPYASSSYAGSTTRGTLVVGDYLPLSVYDDYWNGDGGEEVYDSMEKSIATGELHVMGSIYCNSGSDSCGIFPHLCNYGTIGSSNRYWYQIYASQFFEGGTQLSSKYASKTYEGKAKIGSTAYTFQTTTTTTYTGAANYITFIL